MLEWNLRVAADHAMNIITRFLIISTLIITAYHDAVCTSSDPLGLAHISGQTFLNTTTFVKFENIKEIDPNQFNEDDLVLLGSEDMFFTNRYNDKGYELSQPEMEGFFLGLQKARPMCLFLLYDPKLFGNGIAYDNRRLVASLLAHGVELNGLGTKDRKISLEDTTQLLHFDGVVYSDRKDLSEKESTKRIDLDIKAIQLVVSRLCHAPKRIFFFENNLRLLQIFDRVTWTVPTQVLYKADPLAWNCKNKRCVRFTLMSEPSLEWLLEPDEIVVGRLADNLRLLEGEIHKPYADKEGLTLFGALETLGKENLIESACYDPAYAGHPFHKTLHLIWVKIRYRPPASACSLLVKKLFPVYIATVDATFRSPVEETSLWPIVLNAADQIIQERTNIHECATIIKALALVGIRNRAFLTAISELPPAGARKALMDEMTKTLPADLAENCKRIVLSDQSHGRDFLFSFTKVICKLPPVKHAVAVAALLEMDKHNKLVPSWIFKSLVTSTEAGDIPALFEAAEQLAEAYRRVNHCMDDGLKYKYLEKLFGMNRAALFSTASGIVKIIESNQFNSGGFCEYIYECISAFKGCADDDQRQVLTSLILNVFNGYTDKNDNNLLLSNILTIPSQRRPALDSLWSVAVELVEKPFWPVSIKTFVCMLSDLLGCKPDEIKAIEDQLKRDAEGKKLRFSEFAEIIKSYRLQQYVRAETPDETDLSFIGAIEPVSSREFL